MKKWTTTIYAKSPTGNGEIRKYCGPIIEAPSRTLAFEYCQKNGLGYCFVDDELVGEVDAATGKFTDHESPSLN